MLTQGPVLIVPEDSNNLSIGFVLASAKAATKLKIVMNVHDTPLDLGDTTGMEQWTVFMDYDDVEEHVFMCRGSHVVNRYGYVYLPIGLLDEDEYNVSKENGLWK